MNGINKDDLITIIKLLIPFKIILTAVQYGTGPSLQMVLLSTLQLRQVLSSADELYDFYKIYYKQNNQLNEVDDDSTAIATAQDTNDSDDDYFEGDGKITNSFFFK
jgi:hypothetical protein